jgi:hypothetical protein
MKTTLFGVLASAAALAACGNPPPTAVEAQVRGADGTLSTQQLPASSCVAQAISLAYTPQGTRHVITVRFLNGSGVQVSAGGCATPTWSVAPQGASVQQLNDGSRELVQGELVVTGATQRYVVTAVSGTMSASLGITAGR